MGGWVDGWAGGWVDGMEAWASGRRPNTEYQEGSRNDRLKERNFTPKTAAMIKSPMFSKVAGKLGA